MMNVGFNQHELHFVAVALPRPLKPFYYYQASTSQRALLSEGSWVQVPFGQGAGRSLYGIVVGFPSQEEVASQVSENIEWKRIEKIMEDRYRLSPLIFSLCHWIQDYYCTSLGELCLAAMPLLSEGVQSLVLPDKGRGLKKRSERGLRSSEEQAETLVQTGQRALNEDQKRAVVELVSEGPSVRVLHGVTGSGKTEVYLAVARTVLQQGLSVLVLVPEIALTSQLHERFEAGLGEPVALWHSGMSHGRREATYEALRQGTLRVVVAARSGVFLPLQHLGLLIVDEEHESSYKQEERGRYHARDVAIVRAQREKARVILGSATPSLETQERVRQGKYALSLLPKKAVDSPPNELCFLDLGEEERVEPLRSCLAKKTVQAMQEAFDKGEQVLVYWNKRGYAAFLKCSDCGFVKKCAHCAVTLTLYQKRRRLQCHVCGTCEPVEDCCPQCFGPDWLGRGVGTEGLEEDLEKLFPQVSIGRLDRDQITSVQRLNRLLDRFRKNQIQLLVGTQMLVKGHDFPGVTLVVVLLADALFDWPDFRATEKAYQVLRQVSGRAGRGEKAGKVLIQTYQPHHPVLQLLQGRLEEATFWDEERASREALCYPPFGRLARIRLEALHSAEAHGEAKEVVLFLKVQRERFPLEARGEVLGPSEAFLEKAHRRYRWDVMLKMPKVDALQQCLKGVQLFLRKRGKCAFSIDVDPYQL